MVNGWYVFAYAMVMFVTFILGFGEYSEQMKRSGWNQRAVAIFLGIMVLMLTSFALLMFAMITVHKQGN